MKNTINRVDLTIWEERFLSLAQHVSTWSKDPSTKVGCVIAAPNNKRFISMGFNGFPKHILDSQERLENRELKYQIVRHAEANAMDFAKENLDDSIMYVWPFMTCASCTGQAIQKGIGKIIAPYSDNPRWKEGFDLASVLLEEAGIDLVLVI